MLPLLGLLGALAFASPSPAFAEPEGETAKEAHQHFIEGREEFKKNNYKRALELFEKSQSLYPVPGTLLNVALSEEQLGMLTRAKEHLAEVMKLLPEGDPRSVIAKEALDRVTPRLAWLKLERPSDAPPGTLATLADRELSADAIGVERAMDPGVYTLVVSAPGHFTKERCIQLGEGAHVSEPLVPGEARPKPIAPPPKASMARTVGFALGGVGVMGLGIGAATGIMALAKKGEVEELCPNPAQCTAEGVQIEGAGKAFATVSTVSFALGLAGVGTGVVLVLLGRDGKETKVGVAPTVLSGGGGIGAFGSF